MKQGQTLPELAAELDRVRRAKRDFKADTRRLEMVPRDGKVTLDGLNGEAFKIRPYAHGQIAARVGIPKKYYDRMLEEAPELLATNVNNWMKKAPETRMVRTLDHEVRAYLSDRYRPLENYDLAEAILPTIQSLSCEVRSCALTETRLYMKATLPGLSLEVKGSKRVGDFVTAGVLISNSEVGAGAVSVSDFAEFLVCTNGMTRNRSLRKYHVGKASGEEGVREVLSSEALQADDAAFFLKVRDVVKAAFNREMFERFVSTLSDATGDKMERGPEKVVELTAERYALPEATKESVLKHLIEGADLSRYGLSQAVTRASQDVDDYDAATEMEKAGGQIIELAPSEWRSIAA